METLVIGIDPGDVQSAYACWRNGKLLSFGLHENTDFKKLMVELFEDHVKKEGETCDIVFYVEDIVSMGMAVGKAVFDTAKYIGRLQEIFEAEDGLRYEMVSRIHIKMHHCGTTAAKDPNIRAAMIERFGPKGTKKDPGFFFGVAGNDIWSACAIACYGHDIEQGERIS